jgi:transmembrane sensor
MNTEDDSRSDSSDELAQRIAYLINGYIMNKLSVPEHHELDEWVSSSMENQKLFEELTDPANIEKWIEWKEGLDSKAALERVKSRLGFEHSPRTSTKNRIQFYWAAAAVVIGTILFLEFWFQKPTPLQPPVSALMHDLPPGGYHAVLKLADGTSILLDTVKSGKIGISNNSQVTKDSFELNYAMAGKTNSVAAMNELITPPGGEFQIRLSDGTKVWMNASSSLKYPEQFSDTVRKVELKGEAYFEVSKNPLHPFIVSMESNNVRVLGTHFNVNNYTDNRETIVTLTEGSVKLNGAVTLKPGEEGSIDHSGKIQTRTADIETALAWKEGQFIFKMTPLEEVMKQASHWYDARIFYQDNITDHFNARIPRDVPVSKLLHLLEATGQVHFKIEGKTITVMR